MKKVHIFILSLVIIIAGIVLLAVFANKQNQASPELKVATEKVAQCLANSGTTTFYGASWCPHCARQKALFLSSAKNLPYVECSTAGAGSPQTQICIDENITSYPTWQFGEGVRTSMEIAPIDLAAVSKCELTESDIAVLSTQKDSFMSEMTEESQKIGYESEIKRVMDELATKK